jgi:hypothetical protein
MSSVFVARFANSCSYFCLKWGTVIVDRSFISVLKSNTFIMLVICLRCEHYEHDIRIGTQETKWNSHSVSECEIVGHCR